MSRLNPIVGTYVSFCISTVFFFNRNKHSGKDIFLFKESHLQLFPSSNFKCPKMVINLIHYY